MGDVQRVAIGHAVASDAARSARRMSFNASAGVYHRGRPPYPDAVFELLADRCGLGPGTRVLEIGAGTGQATGPLLAAGARVVAVEPGADLAALLVDHHGGDRLDVVISDFETAEISGDPFDLAVSATAMHWLDPATSTRKIAGLVRPGGWVAAWWNEFGDSLRPTRFRDRLDDVYRDLLPGEPAYQKSQATSLDTDRWQRQLTDGGWFSDVSVEVIAWNQTLTGPTARDLWSTFPNVAGLAPAAREQFLSRLAALVESEPGGIVEDPRLTVIYTAVRTDASP